jgi:outer membrane protein OmpA-like peptidoglycan-associated protein
LGKNINTDGHETGASISVKGDKLYFASDREGGFGGLDLYVSERKKNGKWGEAVNLGPRVNTIYDEDSPLINPEGNVLTFSSKGQNTMGGFDVFTSRLDEPSQSFAVPENKGYPLNTVQSDNTYTSAPDGHAYYSSYRENGTGDLDIFVIKQGPPIPEIEQKQREEFKELAKVQAPLMEDRVNQMAKDSTYIQAAEAERQVRTENETMKDMALAETQTPPVATPVKETKAVSTPAKSPAMVQDNSGPASGSKEEDENLPGDFEVMVLEPGSGVEENETGKGYFHYNPETDMEMTRPVKKETILRLLVLDTDTRLPIDGELLFTDQNTREEIRPVRVRNGVYELALTHEVAKDFMISVEKSGFHFKNIMVNVPPAPGNSNLLYTRNIELKKHTLNKPRILRNVYFDFDEASLSERSLFELDMLKKMLEENDRLVIEVAGHADNMGQDKYNLELSRKRAAKVVEYLASKGIDKARLRAQGYGEAKPVPGTDNTASGRSVNRRTEFPILAQ